MGNERCVAGSMEMGAPALLVSGNGNALQAGRSGGHGHDQDDEQQSQVVASSKKKPRLLQSCPATNNILPSLKVLLLTSLIN